MNKHAPPPEIKVTVHIPDKVPQAVKQRKINIIYDILTKSENNSCNFKPDAL